MIYGLDFDGTYTTAPKLWGVFIAAAITSGHTVIVVTNRAGTAEDRETLLHWLNDRVPVLYSNGRPKRAVALEAGYDVSVWIDDNPILVDYGAPGLGMVGYQR